MAPQRGRQPGQGLGCYGTNPTAARSPQAQPTPQALPLRVRGPRPPKPSKGQHLQHLGIPWQQRLNHLPLKQDLLHQLPQPRQGEETAGIAQLHQPLGAKRPEIGAAGTVRMGHEGRSAGHRHQGGAGSRTRAGGLARSLKPAP